MKKGEFTDDFVDGVTNVISKGVIYYTNLPAGEGGGGSPRNKCKGGGEGAPVGTRPRSGKGALGCAMEAEHNGSASQSVVEIRGQCKESFWDDRKAQMVGRMRWWVARRTAQWASLQDDERQQGSGAPNTPIWQTGLSSNNVVPHPLMDCGQRKINNNGNNGPATARGLDEGSSDVAIGQDGRRVGRARDGVEDAMKDTVSDVPIAIDGVKYPIAGAPRPINKPAQLHKCESIPPPHGATPPSSGPQLVRLRKCESIPPPHGATPTSSGPQLA